MSSELDSNLGVETSQRRRRGSPRAPEADVCNWVFSLSSEATKNSLTGEYLIPETEESGKVPTDLIGATCRTVELFSSVLNVFIIKKTTMLQR